VKDIGPVNMRQLDRLGDDQLEHLLEIELLGDAF